MMADFATPPPFPTAPGAAPVAPTAAPAAPTAAPAAAPATAAAPKERKPRSENMLNDTMIAFIMQNVKTMSYDAMAKALDISKNQVNRALQDIKKGLRSHAIETSKAAGQAAYAQKGTNKEGEPQWDYEQPLTEIAKKVEAKIDSELSRPEEARPGAGKGGGVVKTAINNEISKLLAGI